MVLDHREIKDLYQSFIRSSGHPDPIGYLARAILTSGGDPDYIDVNGKMGFMPVLPDQAAQMVGATNISTLEGNLAATINMDILIFQDTLAIEPMIIKFHDGVLAETASKETADMLESLEETRTEIRKIVNPRLATIKDVIQLLSSENERSPSKQEQEFFKKLSLMV